MIRCALLLLCLPLLALADPLPGPCEPNGGLDYYSCRVADFTQRNPGVEPPDYYTEYGDVYVRRFTHETRPLLSPAGKRWLDAARRKLQVAMEAKRATDPAEFARLELDPTAFRSYAYQTHAPAYESGLGDLPLRDLILIGTTPDIQDTISRDGLRQLREVIGGMLRACNEQGLGACAIERVLIEKRELRRVLRDRLGIPATVNAGRFLWRRFVGSVRRALGLPRTPHSGLSGSLK